MTIQKTLSGTRSLLPAILIVCTHIVHTAPQTLHAQAPSKWDRVEEMARSLIQGKGEAGSEVARRLFLKEEILDILYAQEEGYPVYYVDQDAKGIQDGSSWENAFVRIQPAVEQAAQNEGWIWVAEGVYQDRVMGLERQSTRAIGAVHLKPGAMLFGGFAGHETSLNQRDPTTHVTVITGSRHTEGHRAVYMEHKTLIDGFHIRYSGFENYGSVLADYVAGGGIKAGNWLSVIRENRIYGNSAKGGGGIALWNRDDAYNVEGFSPIVDRNVLHGNVGNCGAGAQIRNAEALFSHNVVVNNVDPEVTKRKGIEIVIDPGVSDRPVIVNSIVWGNAHQSYFYDIYNHVNFVEVFGIDAKAYSWYNCIGWLNYDDPHFFAVRDDPLFVDEAANDFELQLASPCIDAGLPNGPLDSDGTIADIGIYLLKYPLAIIDEAGGNAVGAGSYLPETEIAISVDSLVLDAEGTTKYLFREWVGEGDGAYTGPSRSAVVRMDGPITQTVVWDEEYLLEMQTGTAADTLAGWYPSDETLSLSVPSIVSVSENTRRRFLAWEGVGEGSVSGTDTAVVLTMSGPVRQTAVWQTEHLLTVHSDYGSPTESAWYAEGEEATFGITSPHTIEEGIRKAFVGWIGTGENAYSGDQPVRTITMNGPVTETADWKTQYELTVVSPYGTPTGQGWWDEQETVVLTIDTLSAVDETSRHRFVEWAGTGENAYSGPMPTVELVITGPITETAVWTLQHWLAVGCDPAGGGTVAPIPSPGAWTDSGGIVQLLAVENAEQGYGFDGWTGDIQSTENPFAFAVDAPMQAIARFRQGSIILRTDPPGLTVTVDDQPVTAPRVFFWDTGEIHTVSAVTPQILGDTMRCHFDLWDDGGAAVHPIQATDVQQILTGVFRIEYDVDLQSDFAEGSIVGDGWHAQGSIAQIDIDSIAGGDAGTRHRFEAWSGTLESDRCRFAFPVTGPVRLRATWYDQYELTAVASPPGAGTVILSPEGPWHDAGAEVRLEAFSSDPDMVFYRWEGEEISGDNPMDITVTQPASWTARFNYLYNQPPTVADLPDLQIFEDSRAEIDLSLHVSDPTDPLGDLTYTVDCSLNFEVELDAKASRLTLSPVPDWFGTEPVILTVTDPWTLSDADTFTVNVLPVNDRPDAFSLLAPPDQTPVSSRPPPTTFLWQNSSDVDGDMLLYDFYLGPDSTFLASSTQVISNLSDTTLLKIWTADLIQHQYWKVVAKDGRGGTRSSETFALLYNTAVEPEALLPERFSVSQNYPNPFNPSTRIEYRLPRRGRVRISIFDARGSLVVVLIDEEKDAGSHACLWQATDARGNRMPSGHYYLRAVLGDRTIQKKLSLMK